MDKPRLYTTEAITLRRAPTGEADQLVTLYTPYLGKLRAVARGARRPRSKLGGHLEPLNYARLLLARGRSLDTVSQAETLRAFPGLRTNLDNLARGIYIAELVDAFTPDEHPNTPVFRLVLEALGRLEEGEGELLLRHFELHLLEHLGYRPELYTCVQCRSPITPNAHVFRPSLGGVVCLRCQGQGPGLVLPLSVDALKTLRYLQGHAYGDVRRLRLSPALARELERLSQTYFREQMERELRSAAFLETVRRTPPAPPAVGHG
ncbi:MAG: DNA repair protein RecO [Chloroflexi bacterium]|nr:DNA repair protein RecO [Chloroflexota bacterium]